jgi:hypothetical protein
MMKVDAIELPFYPRCVLTVQDSLTEIAQLFTEFFHEFGDIVPTDIAAGLVLLRRKQSKERKRLTALVCSHRLVNFQLSTSHTLANVKQFSISVLIIVTIGCTLVGNQ